MLMLFNRGLSSQLLHRRVAVSAPSLRPLTCYAAAEVTPNAATTSVKVNEVYSGKVTKLLPVMASVTLDNEVPASLHISMISNERVGAIEDVFAEGDELKAVVVSTSKRGVQLSTKALELVPGQMKTDKQAVFRNAVEGLAQHLKRRQAVTQLQIDELCSGKVTKISPSMASVTLDNNVPASLHVSMISNERVENVGEVFAVGDELKAVVASTSGKKGVMLSTKTLELVPGQMKSDKQAVFANAAEGLARHLAKKKDFMDQRRQALSHLQVGSVVTGTAKVKRTDGWVVALDGTSAVVRWYNLSKDLIRGQSVQILIIEIRLESAKAFATTRFEQKPDGTYQILPRFPAKSTETTAAAKPAAEPATKPTAEPATKPAAEPATQPAAEPAAKPTAEPAAEPVVEAASKA